MLVKPLGVDGIGGHCDDCDTYGDPNASNCSPKLIEDLVVSSKLVRGAGVVVTLVEVGVDGLEGTDVNEVSVPR